MRSCWEQQRSPRTEEFWTEAPYLTREAAEWLLARRPKAVAFDFPQDYPIRLLLKGETRPLEENVTHDVLLRNGVILIEYLSNTAALVEPRSWFCCLPLKIPAPTARRRARSRSRPRRASPERPTRHRRERNTGRDVPCCRSGQVAAVGKRTLTSSGDMHQKGQAR